MPHGPLLEVFPDIFWMQGSVRMGPGVTINRVMVVLRHEGELTVVNAVRPSDPAVLDALGRVVNVVKLGMHGMDDPWYRSHYKAKLWAAAGVEGADVELGADTEQPVPWVRTFQFTLTKQPELALVADRAEGVLLTCDSVQNWPDTDLCSIPAKAVTYAMGFNARPAQIGPPWRRMQTPEGGTLRYDFERLVEMPFDHLIGGHGKPLVGGAKEALRATVEATFPEDA